MAREHRFGRSNQYGKAGEEAVLEFLQKTLPDLKKIEDVSNDPIYQQKDIDAIVHFNNGRKVPIEIKTDSYANTGNIAFESWSSIKEGIPGCMYKTECEELFYYFPDSGELYQIKMAPYREWVEKLAERNVFRVIQVPNVSWGKEYFSENYLIPKVMLKASLKKYVTVHNLKQA